MTGWLLYNETAFIEAPGMNYQQYYTPGIAYDTRESWEGYLNTVRQIEHSTANTSTYM